MTASRSLLRDTFRDAFFIYKEMENNRNLHLVRRSKLPEMTKLLSVDEDRLPVELIKEQLKTTADTGKYKSIIDLFAYYAEFILKKKSADAVLKLIDTIKTSEETVYSRVVGIFTQINDDAFDTKFAALIKTIKSCIAQVPKEQHDSKSSAAPIAAPEAMTEPEPDPLTQLLTEQQVTIKLLQSQNNALTNALTRKETELKQTLQLKHELQQYKDLFTLEKKKTEESDQKIKTMHTLLLEFNNDKKELVNKLHDQTNENVHLNKQLAEIKKYYLFDPSTDEKINENDIKDLISYILADMTLANRYKSVTDIIAVDDVSRKDPEAYALLSLKKDINTFHSAFANVYREELFDEAKPATTANKKPPLESKKQICEQVAAKAISQILECNSLRMFNSGIKVVAQSKDPVSDKELEANVKFKDKIDQLEIRKKAIAAFYEEILKRIENIEKNKIQFLAKKAGAFAKRNYPKLVEQALKKQADEKQQIALTREHSLKIR